MTLSGFWHGVGFQFIVWGILHGVMLTINQAWRTLRPRFWRHQKSHDLIMTPVGFVLTFGAVVVTFVLFRASSLTAAVAILRGMAGLNGVTIPYAIGSRLGTFGQQLERLGVTFDWSSGSQLILGLAWLAVLFVIVTAMPNSLELLAPYRPALDFQGSEPQPRRLTLRDLIESRLGPALVATMAVAGVLGLQRASGFLYWQF
jgi:hypothetical protein